MKVKCNNCMEIFDEHELVYDGEEDMEFCPYCGEGGCIMDLKTYKFSVSLCGGWCNGDINIEAENEETAYEKAMDYVVDKLVEAFPTLDIEYNVECVNPDDEECYTAFKFNQNGIISTANFSNEECAIECAKEYGYHEVVNDITGKIVWKNEDLI